MEKVSKTTLIDATGLPKESVSKELEKILVGTHNEGEFVCIESLRAAMVDYLNQVFLELADENENLSA